MALAVVCTPQVLWAAEEGGKAATHGFDWTAWAFQLVNLVLFVGIIAYFAVPPMREHFQGRRDELTADLKEAERLRKEAEARLEEYTAKLEALEAEREELLEEYHQQGEREKERIIEEAKEQVEKMRADAEATIEQETKKAVAEIEEQAVEMALDIARETAREQLDTSSQHALIENYVGELAERDQAAG